MAAKPFDDLSDDYRQRLIRAARTGKLTGSPVSAGQAEAVARRYHASGDLRAARGHAPRRQATGAAPKRATTAVASGQGTDRDDAALARWRRSSSRPRWLPSDPAVMGNDTAAILSQIDLPPRQWRDVQITEQPDGSFEMAILGTRNQRRLVTLQDRDQLSEVAQLISHQGRLDMVANDAERRRIDKEWKKPKGARSMSLNISYGRTLGGDTAAKTPEQLFGPPPIDGAGEIPQGAERPRRTTAKKAQPAKKAAAKKGAPVRKATQKRATPAKRAARPAEPLGILDDVFSGIDEALSLGEVDTEQAIAALQAQIDRLRRGR